MNPLLVQINPLIISLPLLLISILSSTTALAHLPAAAAASTHIGCPDSLLHSNDTSDHYVDVTQQLHPLPLSHMAVAFNVTSASPANSTSPPPANATTTTTSCPPAPPPPSNSSKPPSSSHDHMISTPNPGAPPVVHAVVEESTHENQSPSEGELEHHPTSGRQLVAGSTDPRSVHAPASTSPGIVDGAAPMFEGDRPQRYADADVELVNPSESLKSSTPQPGAPPSINIAVQAKENGEKGPDNSSNHEGSEEHGHDTEDDQSSTDHGRELRQATPPPGSPSPKN